MSEEIESTKKEVTVADYIKHLKTLPQDYVLMENSGYYDYVDSPMIFPIDCTRVEHGERRVYLKNTGA
jgi:hypothetical protein